MDGDPHSILSSAASRPHTVMGRTQPVKARGSMTSGWFPQPGGLLYSLAVGLKAITSVLCPLMIRASIPAADWIERHLPMPAQIALSQYGAWVELIRKSPEAEDAGGGRRGRRSIAGGQRKKDAT